MRIASEKKLVKDFDLQLRTERLVVPLQHAVFYLGYLFQQTNISVKTITATNGSRIYGVAMHCSEIGYSFKRERLDYKRSNSQLLWPVFAKKFKH